MQIGTLLPLCCLAAAAAGIGRLFRVAFAHAVPFAACLFICVLYAFGLFDRLDIGLITVYALSAACFIYFGASALCRRPRDWRGLFAPGLLFLFAVYAFALFTHQKETLYGWDEAAHWMLTVKNSYVLDRFGASRFSNAVSTYKAYPPGAALFHYFFVKTAGTYQNAAARVGMCVLTAAFLMPPLAAFSGKRGRPAFLKRALVGLALFLLPFTMYRHAYNSMTADCVLGLAFGYAALCPLALDGPFRYASAALGILVTTLIKDSGAFFALAAAAVFAADELVALRRAGPSDPHRLRTVRAVLFALAMPLLPLLARLSFSLYLGRQSIDATGLVGAETLEKLLSGGFAAYAREGFVNYYRAVLYDAAFSDATKFYISLAAAPFCAVFVLAAALTGLGVFLAPRGQRRRETAAAVILLSACVVYVVGTSIPYLVTFPENEVSALSSLARYLGSGLLALLLFALDRAFYRVADRDWSKPPMIALLAALLLWPNPAPLVSARYFDSQPGAPLLIPGTTAADETYAETAARYARLLPYTQDGSAVILYGTSSLNWMLNALAPAECVRAGTPEAVLNRYEAYAGRTFLLYTDPGADLAALKSSALLLGGGKQIKPDAVYRASFAQDGSGFSLSLIAAF